LKILLWSAHRYPADDGVGSGVQTRFPTYKSPGRVHDLLAKGLSEEGHDVFYLTAQGAESKAPNGITLVSEPVDAVDICHNIESERVPWVRTQHTVNQEQKQARANSIFVSQSLARLHGSDRFVLNGVDPADYIFSETKDDYFLFLAAMQGPRSAEKYLDKGLDIALHLARRMGFNLVVAGTASDENVLNKVMEMCEANRTNFVGDVRGKRKAELLAGARALIFPTRIDEGCPLVIAEALMSGTPVICSERHPCPELVTDEVGFVCSNEEDYFRAIENIGTISPRDCRTRALRQFDYRIMTRNYLIEYEREIIGHSLAHAAQQSTD